MKAVSNHWNEKWFWQLEKRIDIETNLWNAANWCQTEGKSRDWNKLENLIWFRANSIEFHKNVGSCLQWLDFLCVIQIYLSYRKEQHYQSLVLFITFQCNIIAGLGRNFFAGCEETILFPFYYAILFSICWGFNFPQWMENCVIIHISIGSHLILQ